MWMAYGAFFLAFVGLSAAVRLAAGMKARKMAETGNPGHSRSTMVLPTLHPFRWIVVADSVASWTVGFVSLAGRVHTVREFEKYPGFSGDAVAAEGLAERLMALPEVKRVYFNSYLVAVEQTDDGFVFFDPLREAGVVWYPPYYMRVVMRLD
jgi:hypothetical protein